MSAVLSLYITFKFGLAVAKKMLFAVQSIPPAFLCSTVCHLSHSCSVFKQFIRFTCILPVILVGFSVRGWSVTPV